MTISTNMEQCSECPFEWKNREDCEDGSCPECGGASLHSLRECIDMSYVADHREDARKRLAAALKR